MILVLHFLYGADLGVQASMMTLVTTLKTIVLTVATEMFHQGSSARVLTSTCEGKENNSEIFYSVNRPGGRR